MSDQTIDDEVRILDCGDAAVSVDFGDRIDPAVNARVVALDAGLQALRLPGIVETVPTYRALLVHLDPCRADRKALADALRRLLDQPVAREKPARRWAVPVVYGEGFGEDIDEIAAHAGLSPDAFVAAHAAATYRVYMVGFMPGFSYLGGMDPRLAMPRRAEPRARVPASSISIGGAQTAIGSVECPSGWHLIGRTPVRAFQPEREPPFLFSPGDEIAFEPIPAADWRELDEAAASGEIVARRLA